ncbi:MAG TPA: MarR family winged helix-turn-helix transcriptional regulator [Kofleriaceae bacterium]|jgi:DNA-binding MarR family transcriptional regulator|nr:MarR family winged helix-turn-helix transcriptional regulator [Kofleriaceae bacterium]
MKPAACLCTALRKATRAVTRLYDEALRPAGLRVTQFAVLRHLVRGGEQRMRDLSATLVVDETAFNRSVRSLHDRGWIAIRTGDDRRERMLSITAAGRALLAEAEPMWSAAQQRMSHELGASWDALMRSLRAVTAGAAP